MKSMPLPCRMDFEFEIVSFDAETGESEIKMIPHPARYSKVVGDGEDLYVDKFLNIAIRLSAFVDAFQPVPIYYDPPLIPSSTVYADDRRAAVRREMETGVHIVPKEHLAPHQDKSSKGLSNKIVSFVSVDVCGSTALRFQDRELYDRAYDYVFKELGSTLGQFHAEILKDTGDGFIAVVDGPSFTTICDNTADLCMTLLAVLRLSVNPNLQVAGLPNISVRIGADVGYADMRRRVIPATGYSALEVTSDALNRSVKIQESANPNEVRIGYSLFSLLHVHWMQRCTLTDFEAIETGSADYKAYVLR